MSNTSATGGALLPNTSPAAPIMGVPLEDLFNELLSGVTGLSPDLVRPRWQTTVPKQPTPETNWLAFGITTTTPDAGPALRHDPDASAGLGADTLARHSDLEILVSCYGPNGDGYANLIQDGLSVPQNVEFLRTNLITYVNSGTIRNVPDKVNEKWIRRWDLLLHFRRKVERSYPVENILSAGFSITT